MVIFAFCSRFELQTLRIDFISFVFFALFRNKASYIRLKRVPSARVKRVSIDSNITQFNEVIKELQLLVIAIACKFCEKLFLRKKFFRRC